jgi:hypothetical protein
MNSYFKSIFFLLIICSCDNKAESDEYIHHQYYLENEINLSVSDLENNTPIYLIDLSSCSGCIEINFNYLKQNCEQLNLELLIVGNHIGSIWQNEIAALQKCYKMYFDQKSNIKRYNISSSKPLIMKFDNQGRIIYARSVHEMEINQLSTFIAP